MKCSWRVFEACKRPLLLGALLTAVLAGTCGTRINGYRSVDSVQFQLFYLVVFTAWLGTVCQQLFSILGAMRRLPVPVTPRQLAYIPLAVSLVNWVIALAVVSYYAHEEFRENYPENWGLLWPTFVHALPLALFVVAFMNYCAGRQLPISLTIFMALFFSMQIQLAKPYLIAIARTRILEIYPAVQIGLLALAAILILYTPARRLAWKTGTFKSFPPLPGMYSLRTPWEPVYRHPVTSGLNALPVVLDYLFIGCLAAVAYALSIGGPGDRMSPQLAHVLLASILAFTAVGAAIALCLRHYVCILSGVASPYSRWSQVVLRVFRHRILRGQWPSRNTLPEVRYCPACARFEPVWDVTCRRWDSNGSLSQVSEKRLSGPTVIAWTYSYVLLMLFFAGSLIAFSTDPQKGFPTYYPKTVLDPAGTVVAKFDALAFPTLSRAFVTVEFGDTTPGLSESDPMAAARTVLADHSKPDDWVRGLTDEHGNPIAPPTRYRVTLTQPNPHTIAIEAEGLRWENTAGFSAGLARLISHDTGGKVVPREFQSTHEALPRMSDRYLDNGVHWMGSSGRGGKTSGDTPQVLGPVFVDRRNTWGWQNGKTWATAYNTLQEGIDAAYLRGAKEVWVARGVYDEERIGDGSLHLLGDVDVYGGFSGGEASRIERNTPVGRTVIDGAQSRDGKPADHVVVIHGGALLDGFTITGGHARLLQTKRNVGIRSIYEDGGGIKITGDGTTQIQNCVVEGNISDGNGGALDADGTTIVIGCTFKGNEAEKQGGAILSSGDVLNLQSCTFEDNTAEAGGAIHLEFGRIEVHRSRFRSNRSRSGAVLSVWGAGWTVSTEEHPETSSIHASFVPPSRDPNAVRTVTFTNCLFDDNVAEQSCAITLNVNFAMTNCTLANNQAADSALFVLAPPPPSSNLTNCILWNNGPSDALPAGVIVSNSIIEGGHPGDSNLDLNPLFADPANGDYHLLPGSPAIDTGTSEGAPGEDLDGTARPQGGGIDLGAYESSGG